MAESVGYDIRRTEYRLNRELKFAQKKYDHPRYADAKHIIREEIDYMKSNLHFLEQYEKQLKIFKTICREMKN